MVLLTNPLTRLRGNGLSAKTWILDHFQNVLHGFGVSDQSLLWRYIACRAVVNSTNCCSFPTHHVVDCMISYIKSLWTLNMIVVQSIGSWNLDFAPFRPLIQILTSFRKVSGIDPLWLKPQQNDHKDIKFDLGDFRSRSRHLSAPTHHPGPFVSLKSRIFIIALPRSSKSWFFG